MLMGVVVLFMSACKQPHNVEQLDEFSKMANHHWHKHLTDVIIADIFTPPVCSRIYAYSHIAAYEAIRPSNPNFKTLEGQLNNFPNIPQPEAEKEYYFPLASMVAFATTAKKLVFAEEKITAYEKQYLRQIDSIGIDASIYENSVAYGRLVGKTILEWAGKDGYLERQALPRHILSNAPGAWQPTPPDYMPGIEPHWNTIRPFLIDSANQFVPAQPTPFDSLPGSQFYQEAMEVYKAVNDAREENGEMLEIAKFWDCNPNISYTRGHVMFFHQKISPGGHWMSIASIVGKQKGLSPMEQAETFTATAIALADAFISCWDEKYRSDLIRPETYIDRYIEQGWEPILQTPAFPEYTSGHSVISAAAATMLTHLHGENFAFSDTTEVEFGLPVREYNSFFEASNEAAISRLYGGIHYRPACFNGVDQGKEVGSYVVSKLALREEQQPVAQKD